MDYILNVLAVLGQIRKGRILYHDQAWSDQISLPLWQQTCKWQAVLSNIIFLSQQALHTSLAGGTRRLHTSLSWKSMFTVQNNIKTAYFDRNRKKSINQSNYLHYQCPKKGTLNFTSRPPILELPKVWRRNCWIGSPCPTKHQTPPLPQQTHKTRHRHRAICRNVFRITINSANMGHPKHSQFLVLIYM